MQWDRCDLCVGASHLGCIMAVFCGRLGQGLELLRFILIIGLGVPIFFHLLSERP